jgi:hypothetical protein
MAVTVMAQVNSGLTAAVAKNTNAWMVSVLPTGNTPAFGKVAKIVSDPRIAPH